MSLIYIGFIFLSSWHRVCKLLNEGLKGKEVKMSKYKLMLCMVSVVASMFGAKAIAKPVRRDSKSNVTVARTRDEALAFLNREHRFAGSILLQPFETEDEAHLAASERYLDSSVACREVGAFTKRRKVLFYLS